ncbi:hypothetical protein EW146_g1029 [Bondarzewia mesenterica]|uniref:F-box domain-containing protein n=1 Tax=Bondarzewia mesenterica TaxID=1095465 RepID=A0A4S4M6L8_9AGAM|nr:hypothetical protein EW146_g1029 [Bondarzewia mesenterica]
MGQLHGHCLPTVADGSVHMRFQGKWKPSELPQDLITDLYHDLVRHLTTIQMVKSITSTNPSSNGNSRMLIVLPTELLDTIASYVDAHCDLVSFAQVCRAFQQIAIPRHTDYRLVRCHYRRHVVWKHLVARPDLTENVRVLEVLGELESTRNKSECVPYVVREEGRKGRKKEKVRYSSAESLMLVAEALEKMESLQKFVWSTSLGFSKEAERQAETRIWRAVSQHQMLQHVEFMQALNPPALFLAGPSTYPMWSISNLKSLSVENAAFLRQEESVRHFSRILQQSPCLESLRLVLYDWSFQLSHLLTDVSLPSLRFLTLEIYADPEANAKPFTDLLERTPTLESLKFYYLSLLPLKPDSLPSLKRVCVDEGEDVPLSSILTGHRAIEAIGRIPLTDRYLDILRNVDGTALRKLELTWFDSVDALLEVAAMFPKLTWFRVPSADYMYAWMSATAGPVYVDQWGSILESLPELEVFHGVSFFKDPEGSGLNDNDDRARQIANTCKALRRVDHWENANPSKVIVVVRDGDSVSWREEAVRRRDYY